jgi:hypothetical protein
VSRLDARLLEVQSLLRDKEMQAKALDAAKVEEFVEQRNMLIQVLSDVGPATHKLQARMQEQAVAQGAS